jgi:hypothetical protein
MRDAQYLRAQAELCLELARQISDQKTAANLQAEAARYRAEAAEIEPRNSTSETKQSKRKSENETMTKDATEFTQQAANLGVNWVRELAEQNLDQCKVVLDGLFKVTRKMAEEFDDQTAAIREHSTALTEKTLSNTFDFGRKLARLREPQELVELQSEFVSRQSQAIAEQTKELGQRIKKGTEKLANLTAATTTKPSRAA